MKKCLTYSIILLLTSTTTYGKNKYIGEKDESSFSCRVVHFDGVRNLLCNGKLYLADYSSTLNDIHLRAQKS